MTLRMMEMSAAEKTLLPEELFCISPALYYYRHKVTGQERHAPPPGDYPGNWEAIPTEVHRNYDLYHAVEVEGAPGSFAVRFAKADRERRAGNKLR